MFLNVNQAGQVFEKLLTKGQKLLIIPPRFYLTVYAHEGYDNGLLEVFGDNIKAVRLTSTGNLKIP